MDETLNLVQVRRDSYSGLYSIQMPSLAETSAHWKALKVRQPVPDCADQFWTDLFQRVLAKLPILQAIAAELSNFGKSNTMTKPATRIDPNHPAVKTNARHVAIREMTGQAAIAECDKLNIPVERHPTNAGITAMRAKNALYARARQQHPHSVADAA